MKKIITLTCISGFFIFLLSAPSARAESWDTSFYKRVKTVVVESYVHVQDSENLFSALGLVKGKKFPIDRSIIDEMLKSVIQEGLRVNSNINVLTSTELGEDYLEIQHLNRDKTYVQANLTYWPANYFTPDLNRDVIVMQIKQKKAVQSSSCPEPTNLPCYKMVEFHFPIILLVANDDTEELAADIRQHFETFFDKHIIH